MEKIYWTAFGQPACIWSQRTDDGKILVVKIQNKKNDENFRFIMLLSNTDSIFYHLAAGHVYIRWRFSPTE